MPDPLADIFEADPLADVFEPRPVTRAIAATTKPSPRAVTPEIREDVIGAVDLPTPMSEYAQKAKETLMGIVYGMTFGLPGEPDVGYHPSGVPRELERSEGIIPTTPFDIGELGGAFLPISKAVGAGRKILGAVKGGAGRKIAGEAAGGAIYETGKELAGVAKGEEFDPLAPIFGTLAFGAMGTGAALLKKGAREVVARIPIKAIDLIKATNKKLQTLGQLTPLGEKGRKLMLARQAEVGKAMANHSEWTKHNSAGLRMKEKEDLIYFIEKTGNPRYKGDTYETLRNRMSTKAIHISNKILTKERELRRMIKESGYSDDIGFIRDYVTHFWRGSRKNRDRLVEVFRRKNPFENQREFLNYMEGQKVGLKPKYNDVFDIVSEYNRIVNQVVQNNILIENLQGLTSEIGGKLIQKISKNVPGTYRVIESPALSRAMKSSGGQVAVHPELYKPINTVFSKPFTGNIVHAIEVINATAKKAKLSFSFFHHLALTESALYSGIAPWKYKKGLKLWESPEYRDMALKAGLDLGTPSDVQRGVVNGLLRNMAMSTKPYIGIPGKALNFVNNKWDRALWDHYHKGLKMWTFTAKRAQMIAKNPNVAVEEIDKAVARHVNNAFGGQNWEMLMKSAKWRQAAHLAFLAPDWTWSNIKIATSAFKTKAGGEASRLEGQLARRYWARAAFWFFTLSNTANYALSGHFMWENEKGHEFDIDTGIKDDKGRRIFTVASKQVREPLRWAMYPPKEIAVKSSPAIHMVIEQITGRTPSGWRTGIDPSWKGTFWKPSQIAERAKSQAGHYVPFAFSGSNIAMSLPIRRGKRGVRRKGVYTDEEIYEALRSGGLIR